MKQYFSKYYPGSYEAFENDLISGQFANAKRKFAEEGQLLYQIFNIKMDSRIGDHMGYRFLFDRIASQEAHTYSTGSGEGERRDRTTYAQKEELLNIMIDNATSNFLIPQYNYHTGVLNDAIKGKYNNAAKKIIDKYLEYQKEGILKNSELLEYAATQAVSENNLEIIKYIANKSPEIIQSCVKNVNYTPANTMLHRAIKNNNYDIVKLLIDFGADPSTTIALSDPAGATITSLTQQCKDIRIKQLINTKVSLTDIEYRVFPAIYGKQHCYIDIHSISEYMKDNTFMPNDKLLALYSLVQHGIKDLSASDKKIAESIMQKLENLHKKNIASKDAPYLDHDSSFGKFILAGSNYTIVRFMENSQDSKSSKIESLSDDIKNNVSLGVQSKLVDICYSYNKRLDLKTQNISYAFSDFFDKIANLVSYIASAFSSKITDVDDKKLQACAEELKKSFNISEAKVSFTEAIKAKSDSGPGFTKV